MHHVYFTSLVYLLATVYLAIYGFNCIALTILYLRNRKNAIHPLKANFQWPYVTIQLPVYNERLVVRRLINAVAALDYPRSRLQIQVLDDSTDSTMEIIDSVVGRWRRSGVDISIIRRQNRQGYKAGALANGLSAAKGEFLAIFDADFVPPKDWLKRTVPYFCDQPRLGFVQTRWGHVNSDYSTITKTQVLALDGHFIVEQTARQRSGLLMNFNGTGGIWRRKCIESVGGWSSRTLCEDLDLSYRAQIAGWECLYLPEVVAPAEVPPVISAFKRQQSRWAMGSVQCLRHLCGPLLRSRLSFWQKLEGLIHLSGYLSHPLMILILLLTLPLLLVDGGNRFNIAYLGFASIGPPLLYIVAQAAQGGRQLKRIAHLPVLVLLGTGIALNNGLAAIRGLLHDGGQFQRTPKFSVGSNSSKKKAYGTQVSGSAYGELALAIYALVTMAVAWDQGNVYTIPFLTIYFFGFAYVALESFHEVYSAKLEARRADSLHEPARSI